MRALRPSLLLAVASASCCAALLAACSSSESGAAGDRAADAGVGGDPGSASGGSGSTASGGAGSTASGGIGGQTLAGLDASLVRELCGGAGCACSNGVDDDGDGQIDGFDTECTGPLDDDESTFATGIPGDNKDPKWQDCFFDGNSGGGDDGCRYPTECLTGEYAPTDARCAQDQACIDFCADLTPNGCDCFGCCTVGVGAAAIDVQISGTCSVAKLDDAAACPRCTKSLTCGNACGTCELCPGKTVSDLPASCARPPTDAGAPTPDSGTPPTYPPNTCDRGLTPCASQADCGGTEYCQQGCCAPIVR